MKIVISSDLYWPTMNGISTFSRNLARGMSERGHDVLVIAPSQNNIRHEEVDGSYRIARLTSHNFPFYHSQTATLPERRKFVGLSVPRFYVDNGFRICIAPQREIRRIIDDFQPDIIHNQQFLLVGQSILYYANKRNIPIIHTNHVLPENILNNLRLIAPFSRPIAHAMKHGGITFMRKFDYITMPTQLAVDLNVNTHPARNKITVPIEVVSNGIELTRFSPATPPPSIFKKFKIPTDTPIIAYIGRIDTEKHIPALVAAFYQIQKSTKAHLLLVGDGIDMANIKDQIRRLGIMRKTTLTGRIDHDSDDIVDLYRASTVFCIPSPSDSQSIVTLEAMACGQPIVAVDAGALRELCHHGRNGFLCEKDNVDQISDGLLKIVTDPALRAKFSAASLALAQKHDLAYTLDRFESIYRSVIKSKKTSAE